MGDDLPSPKRKRGVFDRSLASRFRSPVHIHPSGYAAVPNITWFSKDVSYALETDDILA